VAHVGLRGKTRVPPKAINGVFNDEFVKSAWHVIIK